MTRSDPGAANGGAVAEPGRCACHHLEPMHRPAPNGGRAGCSASTCNCRTYQPKGDGSDA